jgi:uncharacterized membrane protein (DUF4010 family)
MDPLFQQMGIALLLGLLVGLQREHVAAGLAGMRTFPLITILGTASAALAGTFGGWCLGAGLLGLTAVIVLGHLQRLRDLNAKHGTTTDVAMLLMFAVGAMLTIKELKDPAIAIGGGVAVLLQFKLELHHIAEKLGDADLRAIMQFVLITCIILPVLPNKTFDPLDVFNPRETWLMVVLIVGMSLGGYILYKFLGRDAGILLGGVLGGAISSTATTVSYSRGTRGKPTAARTATVVIAIASAVMYVRILISVAVVSRDAAFFRTVAVPMVAMMLLTLAPAMILWLRLRGQSKHSKQSSDAGNDDVWNMPSQENPTQLKSAVLFGLMYAVVLFALAVAKHNSAEFGDRGLYAVAAITGLTEMDAITLSTARMSDDPQIAEQGWRILVIGAMANMCSKAMLAGLLGGWRLFARIAPLFLIPLCGGAAMLFFM